MKHLCYNQWGPQVQRTPHTNRERPAKRALLIVRRVEWSAITGHTLYQDLKGSGRGMKERTYVCCDLKSFYASVECVERGLDPMTTNLVVADKRRTEKTICLAVSPALKVHGLPGRARLFEVNERLRDVNAERRLRAPGRRLSGPGGSAPGGRAWPSRLRGGVPRALSAGRGAPCGGRAGRS